jgi:hypothetical protein
MTENKIIVKQSSSIYGSLSIIFGFIGVLILGLLACLQKEYAAGLIGILFGVIGILTSPILLALLSMPTITIHQYQGVSI